MDVGGNCIDVWLMLLTINKMHEIVFNTVDCNDTLFDTCNMVLMNVSLKKQRE